MDKILVIGSAGREHSLVWKLSQSPHVSEIFSNISADENKLVRIGIDGTKRENFQDLYEFVIKNKVDRIIVGPEIPLCNGIVDFFNERGYKNIFGPTQEAAKLESDKFFSYNIIDSLNIPQAESILCTSFSSAINAIDKIEEKGRVVIKARGLTAGKGVSVCDTIEEAYKEAKKLSKQYGSDLIVAKRLFGEELSVFGFSDGNKVIPFILSIQDYKRLRDFDRGPNTGGMGSYGPVKVASKDLEISIAENFMTPVVKRMKEIGIEYKGFLYAGMIMASDGFKIIEFNARLGDPETQSLMMLLKSDLYEHILDSSEEKLRTEDIKFNPGASCSVVLAARGYPNSNSSLYKRFQGLPISGLERASLMPNVKVFHAGTKRDGNRFLINAGRVLDVTAYSEEGIRSAQELAYSAAKLIKAPGNFHYRKDIADKALKNPF